MLDTNSKIKFRLIRSGRCSAKENMATDKALFENFAHTLEPILRLYTWEKSFTFGVSTKLSDIKNKKELQAYQDSYAKRMTGGGILFHGNDISYALILPTSFMAKLSVKESYEKICSFLLIFYKSLGLNASYAKDHLSIKQRKSVFCQLGFEAYDIVINGQKMGGNAQRRTKDAIFQHGSVGLVTLDDTLHTGNSLKDVGIELSFEEASQRLIESFKKTFGVVLKDSNLYEEEKKRLKVLVTKEAL